MSTRYNGAKVSCTSMEGPAPCMETQPGLILCIARGDVSPELSGETQSSLPL